MYAKSGAVAEMRPPMPSPSICALITPTSESATGWRLKGRDGQTNAAAEAQRVRNEEHRPRSEIVVQQQVEDQRQIWADARRETDAECEPDEEAAGEPGRAALEPKVELAREHRDSDEPKHLHPEDDEE